ncbi:hypothetical protein [Deinococcus roseus]|uniref:Uncharacterized protein n=1 Tax=Deinococcus roseus TaxID=392414 RepID=A0ABQ2D2Z7_9DEIO|nr:hypothetical protein [Deinococcus roseus]GGJ43957.1 hypothetical protein GCM10008938_32770 [Deinococcus roseus]
MQKMLTLMVSLFGISFAQVQWQQGPSDYMWADTGDGVELFTYVVPGPGWMKDPILGVSQVAQWNDYLGFECTQYFHMGSLQGGQVIEVHTRQGSIEKASLQYPQVKDVFEKPAGSEASEEAALIGCVLIELSQDTTLKVSTLYVPVNSGPMGLSSALGLLPPSLPSKARASSHPQHPTLTSRTANSGCEENSTSPESGFLYSGPMLKEQPLSLELGWYQHPGDVAAATLEYHTVPDFTEGLRRIQHWSALQARGTGLLSLNGRILLETESDTRIMVVVHCEPECRHRVVAFREKQQSDGVVPIPIFFTSEV